MRIEICTIPSDGGEEICLTDGKGYNDGPEYSPDGNTSGSTAPEAV